MPGALANSPVVVYFSPAAFSTGCSIEAHAFAAAVEQFAPLGATVISVSTDDLETLTKFSSQACQGKFSVASDSTRSVSKSFDAFVQTRPDYTNRISYVIAPNGSVASCHQSLNFFKHVEKMLAAVKDLPQNRDKKVGATQHAPGQPFIHGSHAINLLPFNRLPCAKIESCNSTT